MNVIERIYKILELVPNIQIDELKFNNGIDALGFQKKGIVEFLLNNNVSSVEKLHSLYCPNKSMKSMIRTLNRLENQLINEVLFFDIQKISRTAKGKRVINLYKRYAAIKSMLEFSYIKLAVYYSEKLLAEAIKMQILDLVILLSEYLEYHYAFNHIDQKKYLKYSTIHNTTLAKIQLKRKVSKLYFEFAQHILSGKSFLPLDDMIHYENTIKDMDKLVFRGQTEIVIIRIHAIRYFYYLLRRDYEELVQMAEDSVEYFQVNMPDNPMENFMSILRRGVAYIYIRQYTKARADLDYLINLKPTVATLHWNSLFSYSFVLYMLMNNYQSGANTLIYVTLEKGLNRLDDMWLQQWRIRSAYVHFLAKIGKVDLAALGKKRVPNFRLGKFLNEVPLYSKDKRGLNISIIIAQFIILLADRKFDKLYDRVEAISKYSYRHLKNDFKLRSNCFIRMLLALVKADYNPIRANRYAEKYLKRLKTTEMNLNEYSTEIEIIPYEQLWEIIIEMLSKKKK